MCLWPCSPRPPPGCQQALWQATALCPPSGPFTATLGVPVSSIGGEPERRSPAVRPPDSRLGRGWTEPAPELSASGVGCMGSCVLPPCGGRDRHHMACCCRGQRNGAGPGPLPALRRAKWFAAAGTELGVGGPRVAGFARPFPPRGPGLYLCVCAHRHCLPAGLKERRPRDQAVRKSALAGLGERPVPACTGSRAPRPSLDDGDRGAWGKQLGKVQLGGPGVHLPFCPASCRTGVDSSRGEGWGGGGLLITDVAAHALPGLLVSPGNGLASTRVPHPS